MSPSPLSTPGAAHARATRRGAAARAGYAALVALATLGACARPSRPPNVVIVLIDTLRPDRLGVYGDSRGLTPAIDALAKTGTVFRHAYAQSSWTVPSVASLFTSRFQSQHGMNSFTTVLADTEDTLAERFSARGYVTGGFVANTLVPDKHGFAQGFDVWRMFGHYPTHKGSGDEVNGAVFQWLDSRSDRTHPIFLYAHYMEPHTPYNPPADLLARQIGDAPPPDADQISGCFNLPMYPMPDALLPGAKALYAAEVAAADRAVGQLLDGLRTRGILDDAIIVLLADHGEAFNDHGIIGHGQTLYNELIHVPLVIVATARPAPRTVDRLVSVIDVAPTLAALTGGPIPPSFEGHSQADTVGVQSGWRSVVARFDAPPPDRAFSQLLIPEDPSRVTPHVWAVVAGDNKLIAGIDGERSYYALDTDPGETNPDGVTPERRAVLDRGLDQLRAYGAAAPARPVPTVDADTRERMRALGYAE
jgi:arylsulfatase A-like enzyme